MRAWVGFPRRRATVALAASVAVTLCLGSPVRADESDVEALAHLKAFSSYMASLESFSFIADTATDVLLDDGRKVQVTATSKGLLDRALGFRIKRLGPYGTTTIWYDTKALNIANDTSAGYLRMAIAGGNDAALDGLRNTLSTEVVGGSDLIYANPYDGLLLEMTRADYLGQAVVDGVLTDHLSVRATDIDWQLWVKAGGDPVPVRYVITSKWITGAPEFSVDIHDFVANVATTAADFSFTPPADAKQLTAADVADLGLLDEE